jgi:hypothetical protein
MSKADRYVDGFVYAARKLRDAAYDVTKFEDDDGAYAAALAAALDRFDAVEKKAMEASKAELGTPIKRGQF